MAAGRLGLEPPFSARQLDAQLSAIPTSKSFSQQIVTPSGTPLGGSVTLTVNCDGTYSVEFTMHSSSILASFDFQLRAYLTGPGLPVFFFYHSGHVSPTGTDDTHPEPGSNPLIEMYWNTIVSSGTFAVAHDYQWSGVLGGVASLVDDLLNVSAAVAGSAIGAVIGLTSEALGWLNLNLGPGGTIGIIAGVAVFVVGAIAGVGVGEALILGVVAGVAAGAVTNALIQSRPMNAAEIQLAQKVFGATLPYERVMLTNLCGLGGRAFTAPGIDGKIYCNLGSGYNNTLGPAPRAYPANGELMIHELTHAWQVANNSFLPGFVCSGIVNQTTNTFGDNVYAYGAAGPPWSSFNLEQQGQIVNQWFAGSDDPNGHSASYPPCSPASPYYQYIAGNILARSAGYSTSWL
ncbi:MAG: hypothetical protein ABI282_11660 [Candidatus Baltobacteraceae bacterium]